MVRFVHRGLGGRYSTYARENVKAISRLRKTELVDKASHVNGYKVAICESGTPLTIDIVQTVLQQSEVTFYFGDSCGLPADIINSCDICCSVSSLPVSHLLEAAIVIQQVEKVLLKLIS